MYAQTVIVGYVGKKPQIRSTTSGNSVANFSIATTEKWKDKSGEKQEKTTWHNLVAFGKTAEVIEKYVDKGSLLLVVGRPQEDKYEDKEGVTRYSHKVVVDRMQMLPTGEKRKRRDDDEDEATDAEGDAEGSAAEGEFNDDIPF